MRATIRKTWNGKYEIVGIRNENVSNDVTRYEMTYLHTFGGKFYKTLQNAIRAIKNKGFEYVETTPEQLYFV